MSGDRVTILMVSVCLVLAGCVVPPSHPSVPIASPTVAERKVLPSSHHKKRTEAQIRILQDFAIKESPEVWRIIQTMRAEISTNGAKLKQLRNELLEFDRNPDADEGYKSLDNGLREFSRAYDALLDSLEEAYIAYKKFEASPSHKDYQDVMKHAIENGIQEATMATERYKTMSRQK